MNSYRRNNNISFLCDSVLVGLKFLDNENMRNITVRRRLFRLFRLFCLIRHEHIVMA